MLPKQKILFIQPSLQPPGGANTVTTWMLQALRNEYDITTLTWDAVAVAEINRYYGTSLRARDLESFVVPAFVRFLINRIPKKKNPWDYLRYCVLMRWSRMVQHRYDLVMSCNGECDFGVRGIQYLHFPHLSENWTKEVRLYQRNRWYFNLLGYLETCLRPWRLLSGFSFHRMKKNLTLVNSEWTADCLKKTYAAEGRVIYPPVPGEFPDVSWEERENGFVCIGRISSGKRLEEIIDSLEQVRQRFPDIHLHIIGSKVPYDKAYYERVKTKVAEHAAWVFLEENLSRAELIKLVCTHRYGIHGMEGEHFGIAVAEMVLAGCITFVPDSGGPMEIVGKTRRLLYHTEAEAVENIVHVLQHPDEQQALRNYLAERKNLFSTEQFMRQIREVVAEFLRDKQQ